MLSAPVAAAVVVIWTGVVLATRYVSLASMISASTAPVWLWLAFHDWLVVGTAP